MQPKEFVICLNSSTPINQYNPKIYKAINSRVNIEIPILKDGLPHLPTSAFNIRGLLTRFKYHLFTNQAHLAQNLYTYDKHHISISWQLGRRRNIFDFTCGSFIFWIKKNTRISQRTWKRHA